MARTELSVEQHQLQQERAELQQQAYLVRVYTKARNSRGQMLRACEANDEGIRDLHMPVDMFLEAVKRDDIASRFVWMDPPIRKSDKKQLEKDRETLEAAARQYRTFGATEANLSLIRDVLGPGFNAYTLLQAIRSNALRLTSPTTEERQHWQELDAAQEQERLRNLGVGELKEEVSAGFNQRRAQHLQANADRVLQEKQEAEKEMGFPSIPQFFQGKLVNKKFFQQCSRDTMRFFIQKYGDAQVTAKIRGL